MIDVQILDDHKLLAEGLIRSINESRIAKITEVYYNLHACRKGISEKSPDILLLDIILPDGNGIEYCKELKTSHPEIKIIMLSSVEEASIVKRCMYNGASGYILKNIISENLLEAIRKVYYNEIYISEEFEKQMNNNNFDDVIWLTKREKEVLELIAKGYSNPKIAEKLFLSPQTVKGYRKDLLTKFEVNNSVTLVKKAIEQKII